jgi:hypothetical protein
VHSEEDEFRDVAEIEAHAATVRTAVLSQLVLGQVGFVLEASPFHHLQPERQ